MQFSPDFVRALVARPYVGNVRELEAALWASVRESNGERLEVPREIAPGLPRSVSQEQEAEAFHSSPALSAPPPDPARVQECLDQHGGSIESTWRALGLTSRHVLVRLIKKHGLRTR